MFNQNILKFNFNSFINSNISYRFFSILYFFILSFSYAYLHEFYFISSGFSFNILKFFEILLVFIFSLYLLPVKITKISDLLISITFFIIICPFLIIMCFESLFYEWQYIYYLLTIFLLMNLFRKFGNYNFLRILKINPTILFKIIQILSLLGILYLSLDVGFNSFNLNPKLVYKFRETDLPIISSYVLSWLSRVTIPLIICFAFKNKRYILLSVCSLSLIIIYGISSEKSILFLPIFAVVASIYFDKFKSLSIIPIFISSIILISILLFIGFDFVYLPSMVIRRSIFVPSEMILKYFSFFDENQFTYWSQNLIGNLFSTYPYDLSPGELINKHMFARYYGSSNCSFFGTAFMHAGIIGCILYGIIMGLILGFIDFFGNANKNFLMVNACSFGPLIIIITSADLPTGILTHGLFLSFLLIPNLKFQFHKKSLNV